MKFLEATKENIKIAASILKSKGLVAFPTETVYGLGADGLNEIAVSKIFEAKQRPTFNPLILHISSIEMLEFVATITNKKIDLLTKKFWPGPLTLILKKKDIVPYIVTSGLDTVAVRMPSNKIALDLINEFGSPIAAPSANSFSQLSPTKAKHVAKQLNGKIDLILDGGKSNVGVESTIIEVTDDTQYLLRPGGIPKEEIEKVIGKLKNKSEIKKNPNSPGQLHIHYAPNMPIRFYNEKEIIRYSDKKLGGIFFSKIKNKELFCEIKILSENGEFHEAASNLFSHLHYMESQNLDMIFVEPVEEKGLGIAIMDRLTKAVNKYK